MSHNNENVPAATPAQRKNLPKSLSRPNFREISPAAISAIDPQLEGANIEFIFHSIRTARQQMYAAIAEVRTRCPEGRLPRKLDVIVERVSPYIPSHLLAVSSQAQKQRITLYPAHSLVIAAYFANLHPLPPSTAPDPEFPGGTIALPVVPLCLPDTSTFHILLEYLYGLNPDRLFTSLLSFPLPSNRSPRDLKRLARKMAESFTGPALLAQAHKVHGLWRNVVALGVDEDNLWRVMETAWEIILGAMQSGKA